MSERTIAISKTLAYWPRHKPEAAELVSEVGVLTSQRVILG